MSVCNKNRKLCLVSRSEHIIILNIVNKLNIWIISGSLDEGRNPVTYFRTSPNNWRTKKHYIM